MNVKINKFNLSLASTLAIATIVALNSALLGITVAIIITTASCLANRN